MFKMLNQRNQDNFQIYYCFIYRVFLTSIITAALSILLIIFLLTRNFSVLLLILLINISFLLLCLLASFNEIIFPVLKMIRQPQNFSFSSKKIIQHLEQLIDLSQKEYARKQTKELSLKQAEFNELQSQINPHFLYNTLESIRAEALFENAPQVANMVRSLSSFYRYCIGRYRTLVTFREELENIENYFSIQQYRFGNRFFLNVSIQPEDNHCLDLKIIKMSLQPLIENAIYHGLETKAGKGHITISVELTQSRFIITVADDGIGMTNDTLNKINASLSIDPADFTPDSSSAEQNTGVGLQNINQRIKMYFGEEYGLLVRSVKDIGTDIEITLPIVTDIEL